MKQCHRLRCNADRETEMKRKKKKKKKRKKKSSDFFYFCFIHQYDKHTLFHCEAFFFLIGNFSQTLSSVDRALQIQLLYYYYYIHCINEISSTNLTQVITILIPFVHLLIFK